MTLPHVLARLTDYADRWAIARGDVVACCGDGGALTWSQLREAMDERAARLLTLGVRRGDRVAVLARSDTTFLVTYLATLRIGAVFVGLNPRYTVRELEHVVTTAKPVVLLDLLPGDTPLAGRSNADILGELRASAGSVTQVAVARRDPGSDEVALVDVEPADDPALHEAIRAVQPADPACLVFTSGSSGTPKGALLPHRGLTLASAVQAEQWGAHESTRMLCNLPINHVGTLGNIVGTALVTALTLVFQEQFSPAATLRCVAQHRITLWGAVPAMFALCVADPAFSAADLSSVEQVVFSGGAMPPGVLDSLLARVPRVLSSYGSTETVGEVTFCSSGDRDDLLTTIGRPDPRYDVRIVQPDGADCGVGMPGELVVRADFTFLGYLDDPAATARTIDALGYVHTGDQAEWRSDGSIRLVGRLSEMYKSGGYNVYPREVEVVFEQHPSVTLAAVVSTPDNVYGEVGVAYVVADRSRFDLDDVMRHARGLLAAYKLPKRVVVRGHLPMLPIGKVDKVALALQSREDLGLT